MARNSDWLKLHCVDIKPPCLGCGDRWVTPSGRCHSSCERYAQYQAELNALKAREHANRDAESDVVNYVVSSKIKTRRRNQRT